MDRELEMSSHLFCTVPNALSEEGLTCLQFSDIVEKMQDEAAGALSIWRLIHDGTRRFHRASKDTDNSNSRLIVQYSSI